MKLHNAGAPRAAVAAVVLCSMATLSFAGFQERLKERWRASYSQLTIEMNDKDKKLVKTTTFPANPTANDHQYIWKLGSGTELHVNVILRRTQALIDQINLMSGHPSLEVEQAELNQIKATVSGPNDDTTKFFAICKIRRAVALKNPLLNFDQMIFSGKWSDKPQFHSQQMAFFDIPDKGNSLYKVSGIKSDNPQFTDMLATAQVTNGRYAGKVLSNLKGANWGGKAGVFAPDINYEATKVVFSWAAECLAGKWPYGENSRYMLSSKYRNYEMDIDGKNLRMLADFGQNREGGVMGPNMDEYDPTYLPNGRIVFVSERHNGGQRCGQTATSGNMYTMKPTGGTDGMGSDIVRISWHETNERSPVVDFNGQIIYSRWDYIDRHAYSAQCMWLVNPDGTDPRVKHGNYIEDDKGVDADGKPGQTMHPISECDIRPIPGAEGKYMGIAGGHHEAYWGNLCVIDVNKRAKTEDQFRWFFVGMKMPGDNHIGDVTEDVVVDGVLRRPKWGRFSPKGRLFTTPYPLSESFVIVGEYDEVLLLDKFRNEIMLFSTKELFDIAVHSPLPLKARQKDPVIASDICQGEDCNIDQADRATISVINVNITDTPWPKEVKIKRLRICQLVPRPKKPWNTGRNQWWGWSDGALLKAVIGTVPVEEDGSAYFQAPIEREIFFQAVDSTGMAVTSMLSGTYVHPGEHLTCVGCHEDKWTASEALKQRVTHAIQKGPASITPEVSGSYPLTYARLVYNSVFIPKCWEACHKTKNKDMDFSYWKAGSCLNNADFGKGTGGGPCVGALEKYVKYYGAAYDQAYGHTDTNMLQMGIPGSKRSRSVPMKIGARACPLLAYLGKSHNNVNLTKEEFHRVTLWLDLNAQELGTYQYGDDPDITKNLTFEKSTITSSPPYQRQRAGQVVWPNWEGSGFDPDNVEGVQKKGKEFPPYYPDKLVGAGAVAALHLGTNPRLMVRGGQLVLTDLPQGQLEVTLYNLAGRAVVTRNFSATQLRSANLVATSSLGAGTYVARLRLNGKIVQGYNQSILIND